MKINLKSIALLAVTTSFLAGCGGDNIKGTGVAEKENRNVAEFQGLNVSGSYAILGSIAKPQKLAVGSNANLLPYIETTVKDGVLYVSTKKGINAEPTVSQNIWFTADTLSSLTLSGSSIFQLLHINTDKLDVNLSGAHQVLLSGAGKDLKIVISGNSDIDAKNLVVENATIEINGSSTVMVNPTLTLKVTINGNGKVAYYSQSPKIEQTVSGSGKIINSFGSDSKPKN